jgi:hypothetical protein
MNNEIILPIELFDGRLSLLEIGTVGVIMSYPHQAKDVLDKWDGTVIFNQTINEMMDRGMITVEGDELVLKIDDEQPKYNNMKIETALNELYNNGICNEDNVEAIRDVMEELSNEFYHLGYEDGRIDFNVDGDTFTAYGKKEDFS